MRVGSGPQAQVDASLVPRPSVVAEGDVQFLLDLRVLGPVPLHETQERPVAGSVTKNGTHLMALCQLVPCRPETFKQLNVVGVEYRIHTHALQIRPPLKEEI